MNEAETMIHRKRKITIWIITIAIIAVALFGAGKYISYRTMPPFAAEQMRLKRAMATIYNLMISTFGMNS